MTGTKQLVIDASDFIKGMSSGANISDGGFSNETDNVNLIYDPGVVHAPASAVDADTDSRLTGNIIAMSNDDDVYLGYDKKVVTDDGKYYRYNGTKLAEAALRTDAVNTYAFGFTDMISFAGETYVTTKEKLVRWDETGATFNASFASFTSTTYPHSAIVYENNAYYADGNLLKQQTSAGGTPATILTLSADQIIMALGVDPSTGLMLISTTTSLNMSGTLEGVNRLMWYDGNSTKVSKSVIVEALILSFRSVGGTTFVGYGKNIGYINGSGISFLRKLKNVTLNSSELPYKHHLTNIGDTLYVVDGKQILAFGEVVRGSKVFYNAYINNNSLASKFTAIGAVGSGKLGLAYNTSVPSKNFFTLDTTSVSTTNTLLLYSNRYQFPRPVILRSAYIEYSTAIAPNDDNRSLYYQSENLQAGFQILAVQGQTGTSGLKNTSTSSVYFIDNVVGFLNNKMRSLQLRYSVSTGNSGLKRIVIYYDVAE